MSKSYTINLKTENKKVSDKDEMDEDEEKGKKEDKTNPNDSEDEDDSSSEEEDSSSSDDDDDDGISNDREQVFDIHEGAEKVHQKVGSREVAVFYDIEVAKNISSDEIAWVYYKRKSDKKTAVAGLNYLPLKGGRDGKKWIYKQSHTKFSRFLDLKGFQHTHDVEKLKQEIKNLIRAKLKISIDVRLDGVVMEPVATIKVRFISTCRGFAIDFMINNIRDNWKDSVFVPATEEYIKNKPKVKLYIIYLLFLFMHIFYKNAKLRTIFKYPQTLMYTDCNCGS